MSSRGLIEKDLSDQQTILRSWSIKRYSSNVPQYIQLFRPENKVHVTYAGSFLYRYVYTLDQLC